MQREKKNIGSCSKPRYKRLIAHNKTEMIFKFLAFCQNLRL